jgi:hypothetical protein
MNGSEAHGCAKGYAWARNDADGSVTVQRAGDSSSGDFQFSVAYGRHWEEYNTGKRSSATNVRSAWESWNRTAGLTVDYMDIPYDGQARRIASEWHSGQASALYSLSSCGAITPDVAGEITREMNTGEGGKSGDLRALLIYVTFHGPRDRQDGWADQWSDYPVRTTTS